jgi:hypothetical protein
MVWAGIGLELVYVLAVSVLIGGLTRLSDSLPVAGVGSVVLGLLPLVGGIVLAAVGRTPRARGLGLGFAIGWAVWLIVGAGVCVAVFAFVLAGSGA